MSTLRLALRLLARDWRAGELRVLIAALVLAVASVGTVGFFADRVKLGLSEQANLLRLFVGTVELPPAGDRIWVLETNLDDLPGEVVGYTMIKLMEGGALDAFVTPIQMKKNRPAVMVSVLCDEACIPALEEILTRWQEQRRSA